MDQHAQDKLSDLRARFMAGGARKTKTVKFGEAEVVIKQLSALQSRQFLDALGGDDGAARLNAIAEMITLSVYDTEGNQLFSKSESGALLDEMGTSGFGEIGQEVLEMNGANNRKREEALKNSTAPAASGLLSDSPDT